MKAALIGAIVGGLGTCFAGPTEQAILAAMKLSEEPSYAWVSVVHDDARAYEIEGKTEKNGCTWVRLPMVESLSRRLGRQAESNVEALFRNGAALVLTEEGWKTLNELPKRHSDWQDHPLGGRGAPAPVGWGVFDPFTVPVVFSGAGPRLLRDKHERRYSNAQFGVSHPHEELGVIVCSYTSLQVADNVVTGTLSDLGAQLLLVRDGQEHIKPLIAAGTFRLQLRDDVVVNYALQLEGILQVGRKKVHVRQSSRTLLKDVARTKVEVPAEVLGKFER